ncbi:MAG: hypothetical protein PWQ08_1090 [Clostridiales bacterium]|nr:hypothetical protein [Clostridiales bacterium]
MSMSSELFGKKLEAYGKKIPGLGLYASVLLPVIALLQLVSLVVEFQTLSWLVPFFVLNCLALVLCVAAFFALRQYNAFGYWCNLAFLVSLIIAKAAYIVWALSGVAGAANMTQAPGYVGLSSVQAGPASVIMVFEVLLLAAAVFYLVVFLRNRKFFFTEAQA